MNDVLNFWFKELSTENWFKQSDEIDDLIKKRFLKTIEQAKKGEMFSWRTTAEGRLAEIIVLDQFTRNVYRGTPDAFSADPMALVLAQELVAKGHDKQLEMKARAFAYMPYMHSESLMIHEEAVKLFSQTGLEFNLKFEIEHKEIIEKFGRYPHRNKILARTSTAEELEFLKNHSGF